MVMRDRALVLNSFLVNIFVFRFFFFPVPIPNFVGCFSLSLALLRSITWLRAVTYVILRKKRWLIG